MIKHRRNNMYEIVERIKDVISFEVNGKVFDKHVAKKLQLSPNTLRVYKVKNIIPYERIAEFCLEHNISFDWLVFGSSVKSEKIS